MGFTKDELKRILPELVKALRDLIKNPVCLLLGVARSPRRGLTVQRMPLLFDLGTAGSRWHQRKED